MGKVKVKIIIIHGVETKASMTRLNLLISKAIEKDYKITRLENQDREIITSQVLNADFFETKKMVVFENVPYDRKILDFLLKNKTFLESSHVVIFYFDTELKNKLPSSLLIKVEKFGNSNEIYYFVQDLYKTDEKVAINKLFELKDKYDLNYIFYCLCDLYSDLLIYKFDSKLLDTYPWRLNIIRNIAEKYSLEKLKIINQKLTDIDLKMKQSEISNDISALILAIKAVI